MSNVNENEPENERYVIEFYKYLHTYRLIDTETGRVVRHDDSHGVLKWYKEKLEQNHKG